MIPLAIANLAAAPCVVLPPPVRVQRVAYHGWKDCWRLDNGTADLVFVPAIGRVMRFGFVGGPNALWENPDLQGKTPPADLRQKDWMNFGGDKLWPAPQDRWGWPPDPGLDAGGCRVEERAGGILVTGRDSARHGIRFTRMIRLLPGRAEADLSNVMVNVRAKPVEWSIWEVMQVNDPLAASIPVSRTDPAKPYYAFQDSTVAQRGLTFDGDTVELRRDRTKNGKIGTDSPGGWAGAVFQTQRLVVSARWTPGTYPDHGCVQEVYSNPDPARYMELELLSPMHTLAPRASAAFATHWQLERTAAARATRP